MQVTLNLTQTPIVNSQDVIFDLSDEEAPEEEEEEFDRDSGWEYGSEEEK